MLHFPEMLRNPGWVESRIWNKKSYLLIYSHSFVLVSVFFDKWRRAILVTKHHSNTGTTAVFKAWYEGLKCIYNAVSGTVIYPIYFRIFRLLLVRRAIQFANPC